MTRSFACAADALRLLADAARQQGYAVMTAQVRADNAASIALHSKMGFTSGEPWINRRGNAVYTFRKTL